MKPRRLSEKAIQAALLDRWRKLGKPGTLVTAIPNAGAFGQSGLTRGLFDLIVIGGNVGQGWIELKTETGKLSPYQTWFRDILLHNHISYAVTYGLDQAIRALEAWDIIRTESVSATGSRVASEHTPDCEWQHEQYAQDCACGAVSGNSLAADRPGRAGDGEASASPDPGNQSPSRAGVLG